MSILENVKKLLRNLTADNPGKRFLTGRETEEDKDEYIVHHKEDKKLRQRKKDLGK